MIGELYEGSLAGLGEIEIEYADGRRIPLRVQEWLRPRAGDAGMLDRCVGPCLDIGSGPGRLTLGLAERGLPVLGLDVTPYAVELTRAAGGLALCRDVFGRVPGTGRWACALLADGNIGIGGDPGGLLRRVGEVLRPGGRALVEVAAPGTESGTDWVRLHGPGGPGEWFRWAHLSIDAAADLAARCGLGVTEHWTEAERWFVALTTTP